MMDENNQLIQCTVGSEGELSLRKVQIISLGALPAKMLEAGKELKGKIQEVRKDTQGR